MLWLCESGMPMHFDSWKMVFQDANRRCEALAVSIRCSSHMLRHSFALRWWAVAAGRIGFGENDWGPSLADVLDPWVMVQQLLGHRSPETTRDIYLAPTRDLDIELFLRDDGIARTMTCWPSWRRDRRECRGGRPDVTQQESAHLLP